MRRFNLHASKNFKGGMYFASFDTESIEDFYEQLTSYWDRSGMTRETGEMFVYTDMGHEGEVYAFEVGYYCLDCDDIDAVCNVPDDDEDDIDNLIALSIVGEFNNRNDDAECFKELVKGLLS